jgi:hypothetical protein
VGRSEGREEERLTQTKQCGSNRGDSMKICKTVFTVVLAFATVALGTVASPTAAYGQPLKAET